MGTGEIIGAFVVMVRRNFKDNIGLLTYKRQTIDANLQIKSNSQIITQKFLFTYQKNWCMIHTSKIYSDSLFRNEHALGIRERKKL